MQIDVTPYQGFVKARVLSKYNSFPEWVKNSVSVEDIVQEGLLHLHKTLNQLEDCNAKFNKKKSSITTYIYHILDNYFEHLRKTYCRKKRRTILVSLDDVSAIIGYAETTSYKLRVREARDKVISLHLQASPQLIDFLAENIYHPVKPKLSVTATSKDFKLVKNPYTKTMRRIRMCKYEIVQARREEFLRLAKANNVKIEDYRLALSAEQ